MFLWTLPFVSLYYQVPLHVTFVGIFVCIENKVIKTNRIKTYPFISTACVEIFLVKSVLLALYLSVRTLVDIVH